MEIPFVSGVWCHSSLRRRAVQEASCRDGEHAAAPHYFMVRRGNALTR
jgi:hypothetical protein